MKSFKHRLELNNKQTTLALKHAGVARHAYNWGVNVCKEASENNAKLPSSINLHKLLVITVKKENPWYYEVSKCTPQQSLRNLETGWKRYFSELKNGEIEKKKKSYIKNYKLHNKEINNSKLYDLGKPKFKKKGKNDSFYLEGNYIVIKDNKIKVPIFGWLKMSESYDIPFTVKNVIINKTANEWFISFHVDYIPDKTIKKEQIVGVDLGIKTLATLSNGETFENIKPYKNAKHKLRKIQKEVSRRYIKGAKSQSSNYKKSVIKLAKTHAKIANIRKDSLHKLTSHLAKDFETIVIEDLNIQGMVKNHNLASAILDGGFYEFKRQLLYKKDWYGGNVILADRFFPSSKLCSSCGNKKTDLKLSDRTYVCEHCNLNIDRDLNASINLKNLAVSSTVSAFGDGSSIEKSI